MAIKARLDDPPKDDPTKTDPPPKDDTGGDKLSERIDGIERTLQSLVGKLGAGDPPKEDTDKPRTRVQREADYSAQIKEEIDKLRKDEASDKERQGLVKRIEAFEEELKKEKAPEMYGKFAKFFFPGSTKTKGS
jgi:hypothetical protein